MTEFHLLIDDLRTFNMDYIARNAHEGIIALKKYPVTHLYMDHDLGNISNGYSVLSLALEEGFCPSKVTFVTSNPVGRDNRIRALKAHGYIQKGHWFVKN